MSRSFGEPSVLVNARYPATLVKALDDWRRKQPIPPTRQEAIRRILTEALMPEEPEGEP